MSSLPFISHHLFVAAVRHDRRASETLPPNPTCRQSSDEKPVPANTSVYKEELDHAMANSSGSLVE
ncbi:MAG TPA: hypothetical protein VL361_04120 [Candidatus Limnocylindrales bacterium]|jgi:hypothetical protein|nr:hypothetical protein [Candidatus Limnocylindrales bacterium]